MPLVRLDVGEIEDFEALHDAFAAAFGFPDFYGRNMNAWIDCMESLDRPGDGLTAVHGTASDPVVLHLENASALPSDVFAAVHECAALVNWRRVEVGEPAILVLSYHRVSP